MKREYYLISFILLCLLFMLLYTAEAETEIVYLTDTREYKDYTEWSSRELYSIYKEEGSVISLVVEAPVGYTTPDKVIHREESVVAPNTNIVIPVEEERGYLTGVTFDNTDAIVKKKEVSVTVENVLDDVYYEDTGYIIDPVTGLVKDPETGYFVDVDTGLLLDPDTGLPLEDTGLSAYELALLAEQERLAGNEEYIDVGIISRLLNTKTGNFEELSKIAKDGVIVVNYISEDSLDILTDLEKYDNIYPIIIVRSDRYMKSISKDIERLSSIPYVLYYDEYSILVSKSKENVLFINSSLFIEWGFSDIVDIELELMS